MGAAHSIVSRPRSSRTAAAVPSFSRLTIRKMVRRPSRVRVRSAPPHGYEQGHASAFRNSTRPHHHDETSDRAGASAADGCPTPRSVRPLRSSCARPSAPSSRPSRERRGISLHTISERHEGQRGALRRPRAWQPLALADGPLSAIASSASTRRSSGCRANRRSANSSVCFPRISKTPRPRCSCPGPLRLTLARPFWRHLSPMHAVAAGIDLVMVLLGATAVAQLANVNFWIALGVMAVAYHTVGTSIRGCSLGTMVASTCASDDSARRRRGAGAPARCGRSGRGAREHVQA